MTKRKLTVVTLALAAMISISAPLPLVAKDYPYRLEIAETLHALDELKEASWRMLSFDRFEAKTNYGTGPCGRLYRASTEKKGGNAEEIKRWDECFTNALEGSALGVKTYKEMVTAYGQFSKRYADRLRQMGRSNANNPRLKKLHDKYPTLIDYITETTEITRIHKGWVQETNKLELDNRIGTIQLVEGKTELERSGRRWQAIVGDRVVIGDRIRTGPKGQAWVYFMNYDKETVEPTVEIIVGNNTEIKLTNWDISYSDQGRPRRAGLYELIRGVARTLTQRQGGSIFSVRAGTTVCGIRGTEVDTIYSPERHEVIYRLLDGEVEIQTGPGRSLRLHAGQMVTVTEGVPGPVRQIGSRKPPSL